MTNKCFRAGRCIKDVTVEQHVALLEQLYGPVEADHSSRERHDNIVQLLNKSFQRGSKVFKFPLKDSSIQICEGAFLYLTSLSPEPLRAKASKMYQCIRHCIVNGTEVDRDEIKRQRYQCKTSDCNGFILNEASRLGDKSPTNSAITILPYFSVVALYEDYVSKRLSESKRLEDIASKSTFTRAWKSLYTTNNLRLQGAKGAFKTCDVCQNIGDILKSGNQNIG